MKRQELLKSVSKAPVSVEVNGVTIWLKPWSITTKEIFLDWRKANTGILGIMEKLLVLSLCDESGALLFSDTKEDMEEVGRMDGAFAEEIADKVLEIHGLKGDDPKAR